MEKTSGFEVILMWNPVFPSLNCSIGCSVCVVVSRFSVHHNCDNSAVGKTNCALRCLLGFRSVYQEFMSTGLYDTAEAHNVVFS